MIDFRNEVRRLAEAEQSDLIKNKGLDHAACLMSTIFDNSKSIKMLSGSLSKELTDKEEYRNSLANFLKKEEVSFQLLLQNNPPKEDRSDALLSILSKSKDNDKIEVKFLNESKVYDLLKSSNDENDVHFTLGDKNKYRYEYQPEEFRARASFNDIDTNSVLQQYFDKMYINAETIA